MKRAPIVTTLLLATVMLLTAAAAVAGNRPLVRVTQGPPVPDQYVVVFSDQIATLGNGNAAHAAEVLAQAFNASYGETWDHAIKGAVFRMNEQKAEAMARHPLVDYVAEDGMASVAVNQFNPPSWGLDRIDQLVLPLNLTYAYGSTGSGATVYVIDTGIRTTHNDFGGRASWGADFIGGFVDCNGHGTHVAGTAGGTSFGVAKGVGLVAVRVLDCGGSGTFSQVISGVNWVTANATMPAVANMSLIGGLYPPLNTAVSNSVAAGVFYAVAAGNYNANACNYSPASTPTAYTVGATDWNDNRAWYSNYGTCLDIFAPGSQITSAWNTSDTATNTIDGTSMATPHVAGAAALVLDQNPTWTPAQVSSYLTSTATPGVVVNPGVGSPNLLLNTIPLTPLGRTDELFPKLYYDHRYVHSGTHLQGVRADEKWAGGLIHQPPPVTGFDNMTAAVVVDNPDLNQWMTVDVQFYDSLGNTAGPPISLSIPPEGFQAVAATPLGQTPYGMGTARATVVDGPPLVGVTLQHAYTIMGITDPEPPGASSMQQLQVVQDNTTRLRWGPMPISLVDPQDFLNFNTPWFHVVNPNNAFNVLQVDVSYYDRVAGVLVGPITWRVVVLPPHGTLTEISGPHLDALMGAPAIGLFNQLIQLYFSIPGIDWDVWVDVVSLNELPILGDGYLLDAVGLSEDQPRFRMASTMMASDVAGVLESPELSYQPGGIIQTLFGVTNVGAATGPLAIQYYNKNGALLSTGNVASLPAGQSLRIYPGTFNYPTGTVDFGWLRIIGSVSDDQLVGWTVREILEDPKVNPQYHKAYGEALLHLNWAEPGPGWTITDPIWPVPLIRKVIPFTRVQDTSFEWPGYSTFVNSWGPNVNNYRWELWDGMGTFCGNLYFPGVPYAHTSWTYEDILNVFCWWGPLNVSGRVDHEKERIEGIDVIGDPLWEYGIPGFAGW